MVAGGNDAIEGGGGIVCSRLAYRYQTYHNPRFLDIAEHRACSPRHNWSCCNSLHPGFPIGLLPLRIITTRNHHKLLTNPPTHAYTIACMRSHHLGTA